MVEKSSRSNIIILVLSLFSCLILMVTFVFYWTFVDVTSYLAMPAFTLLINSLLMTIVWIIVLTIFLITFIVSLVVWIRKKMWKPFVIHMITLIVFLFFPTTLLVVNLNHALQKEARLEVIKRIASKELVPNDPHNSSLINLPIEYYYLSKSGGGILVGDEGKQVLFFILRDFDDNNFSGFIYSSDDQKPEEGDFGGSFKEMKRMEKNWFWVSTY